MTKEDFLELNIPLVKLRVVYKVYGREKIREGSFFIVTGEGLYHIESEKRISYKCIKSVERIDE